MANTNSDTGGLLGVNYEERTTTAEFALGTTSRGTNNRDYLYVVAGGVIAASQSDVAIDANFSATDGAGAYNNVTAFASGEYGWIYKTAV